MEKENKIVLALVIAVVIGILIGIVLAENVSWKIGMLTSDVEEMSSSIKDLRASIDRVDTSVNEIKTNLAEPGLQSFRREMQANGRRMLSIDYAGKFARWSVAKQEVEELNKTLQNSADLRPSLARNIQEFQTKYIPKLNAAADKRDAKNFEAVWAETYNACIACHESARAPLSAYQVLREIGSEVEQLSG